MGPLARGGQSVNCPPMRLTLSAFVALSPLLAALALAPILASPTAAQVAEQGGPVAQGAEAEPSTEEPQEDPVVIPNIEVVLEEEAAATPPPIPVEWSPAPRDPSGQSAYGLYLAGRLAFALGEGETGAQYLSQVQRLTPEQPRVREQAFTTALMSGDLDYAARIAPSGGDLSPVIVEAGRLVEIVQTYVNGDARAALTLAQDRPVAAPHRRAAILVQPWIAAEAGDWDSALAAAPPGLDPLAALFYRHNRAMLLESRRDYAAAEAELASLVGQSGAAQLFRLSYGEFLERRGRPAEAKAVYDAGIGAAADAPLRRASERLAAGGRPPVAPAYREGAALALAAAAAQASAEGAHEFAVVYLRLSLNLRGDDEIRMLLGQTLAQGRLEVAARAALDQIGPQDPEIYAAARTQIAMSLQRDGESEAALAELRRAAAAAPDDPRVAYMTAALLSEMQQNEEALALLNGPLLNTARQGFDVRFMRGAVYESLGRLPEAEAELWAAVEARPDDATALNYLGYLWVDSGRRVDQGVGLIERAHAADPDDGNIQDSLGWARYRQGRYADAVPILEGAVDKLPANAEINDHLGDAYWQVGRKREAGFQWTRVLSLDIDPERRASVEKKLAEGLTAPTVSAD